MMTSTIDLPNTLERETILKGHVLLYIGTGLRNFTTNELYVVQSALYTPVDGGFWKKDTKELQSIDLLDDQGYKVSIEAGSSLFKKIDLDAYKSNLKVIQKYTNELLCGFSMNFCSGLSEDEETRTKELEEFVNSICKKTLAELI